MGENGPAGKEDEDVQESRFVIERMPDGQRMIVFEAKDEREARIINNVVYLLLKDAGADPFQGIGVKPGVEPYTQERHNVGRNGWEFTGISEDKARALFPKFEAKIEEILTDGEKEAALPL